uniref:Ig-like domain-containing protein n=1 Tax=Stegastes partitus TaxID=144197 RepID=A0A3B4ZTI1_9TELE
MRGCTAITVLLVCCISESYSVKVQSGKDVTLMCSNISTTSTQTDWFRVVNRTKPSCISSMYNADTNGSLCDGFQNGKFEMSSNVTTVFLKIKRVDVSDIGLYFCGFYIREHTVISTSVKLRIQGKIKTTHLMSVILGGVTAGLTIVVIVLAVQIWKLQKGTDGLEPFAHSKLKNDLNYAAVTFQARSKRSRRPAPVRAVEPHDAPGTAAQSSTQALSYSPADVFMCVCVCVCVCVRWVK